MKKPDVAAHASHAQMLRHTIAPARLRESFALARPPSVRNGALAGGQAALAVVLAAGALHYSPWPEMAGFAGLGGMAALFGRFGSPAQCRRIVFAAGCLLTAPVALLSLAAWFQLPMVVMLLLFSLMAGALASVAHRTQVGAPGAVIFVFAASAAITPIDSASLWWQRVLATALGALLAYVVCALTDPLRDQSVQPAAPVAQSTTASPLPPLTPGYAPSQSLRVALCAAIASLGAYALGWSHPAWAAIGAIAIMQGIHLPHTIHRAWQRTIGTIIGAGIAWAILSTHPDFWHILAVVAVLQFVTEVIIGYNYALGQMAITPMALLMTALSGHAGATEMAVSRIYDTALGALVGIALALLFSTLDERMHLARHHSGKH